MRRPPKRWHQPRDAADAHRLDADRALAVAQLRARFPALEAPRRELVAHRLEHMLFHAAHSRAEFARSCSLARRVQALVTLDLASSTPSSNSPPPLVTRRGDEQQDDAAPSTRGDLKAERRREAAAAVTAAAAACRAKRPRRASVVGVECATERRAAAGCKRRRRGSFHGVRLELVTSTPSLSPSPPSMIHGAMAAATATRPTHSAARDDDDAASSTLFLDNDADLLALVFGFLDGHELLRARAVNRFLAARAPRMVHSLTLDARRLSLRGASAAGATVSALLPKCANLRRLVVTNSRNAACADLLADLPRGYSLPVAAAAPEICYGSQVLAQVTAALRRLACRSLETLELRAPFEFATESDTILECIDALAYRHASYAGGTQRRPAALKRLVLDATFLGDARVRQLADRLQSTSSAAFFRELETLHLRGNFVGEAGCEALFQHLHRCPRLRELDMSGNILTDTDAVALAAALRCTSTASSRATSEPRPTLLHRIALHENYIGLDGFCALSSAICTRLLSLSDEEMDARGNGRSLVEVTCARNCALARKVARLFRF